MNKIFNRFGSLSIKYKIAILVNLAILVLLLIAGFSINQANRSETQKSARIIIEQAFLTSKMNLENFLQERWADLNQLSESGTAYNNESLRVLVSTTHNNNNENIYERIYTISATGTVVASSAPELIGQNFSSNSIFTKTTGKTNHYEIKALDDGRVLAYFCLHLAGGDVVVAEVNNDRISMLLQSVRPYPASSDTYMFTLADSDLGPAATAISQSAFEKDLLAGIKTSKGEVKVKANTEMELKFFDPNTGAPTLGVSSIIKDANVTNMIGYPDYRHIPVVGVGGTVKFSDDFGAGLIAEADLNVSNVGIHGRDEDALKFLSLFALLLLLVSAVAAYFLGLYLTKRIDAVKEFINHNDDLQFRLTDDVQDEIGILATGINSFLDLREEMIEEIKITSEESKALADQGVRYRNMIDNMPVNVITADPEGVINSINPTSIKTLKTLQHLLPVPVEEILGKSFDMFHKQPSLQKSIVANPVNLPHKATIRLGEEYLDLLVSPLFDSEKNYVGPMLTWEVVTARIKAKERENLIKQELEQTIETLVSSSSNLGDNTNGLSESMAKVSAVTDEVGNYINSVSVASEELISSISEISNNTDKAANMTRNAVSEINMTEGIVKDLQQRSDEITSILKVVAEIANQTNLLALNATIEAARAGEAGKGFAVVANEVKELANRTSEATEDITNKIQGIQKETNKALNAIETASVSVKNINEVTVTIAGAVEEQTAVTSEIGRSMQTSTEKVSEMVDSVRSINALVTSTYERTNDLNLVASQLKQLASNT